VAAFPALARYDAEDLPVEAAASTA
jgi:hypothetical protein